MTNPLSLRRILIHDYCGHPFPTQLSRTLSVRGHEVLHVYSQSVVSPQATFPQAQEINTRIRFLGIDQNGKIDRAPGLRRLLQERAYGRLLAEEISHFRPNVVVSSNAPLEAQVKAFRAASSINAQFVFWLQDIHGLAIEQLLSRRFALLGKLVGSHYRRIEQRLLRGSDAVVAISSDFATVLSAWGIDHTTVAVIPNWASPGELPVRPKSNPWAHSHSVDDRFCFLYSGTLGMKHNPELLLSLALHYERDPSVVVVVVSEGPGVDWLTSKKSELNLTNLKILPFQPYVSLPDVMGSADVLVAILEPGAGAYSVPSKVLSYLCAARPLLLSVPPENLAARIVTEQGAGMVVAPGSLEAFLRAADELRSDQGARERMRANALRYALEAFDIENIADQFEAIFNLDKRPASRLRHAIGPPRSS